MHGQSDPRDGRHDALFQISATDDGKTVTEFGMIESHDASGVPITMIRSISLSHGSVRLLIRPWKEEPARSTPERPETEGTRSPTLPEEREHRWSNELFVNDKEESHENHENACSLVLDDYDCRCQRMFDGSQSLHTSQNVPFEWIL